MPKERCSVEESASIAKGVRVVVVADDFSRDLIDPIGRALSFRGCLVQDFYIAAAEQKGDRRSISDLQKAFREGAVGILISSSGSGLGMVLNKLPGVVVTTCFTRAMAVEVAELPEINGCEVAAGMPLDTILDIAVSFVAKLSNRNSGSRDSGKKIEIGKTLQAAPYLHWPTEVERLDEKSAVAQSIADIPSDGDVIGIGSGSSAYLALRAIAKRVREEEISIKIIPSSYEIEIAASSLGLPTATLREARPVWVVDGADEVDDELRVLKGRGGALFREKLLWQSAPKVYVATDSSKRVSRLGTNFPVPIEVHPAAVELLLDHLAGLRNLVDAGLRPAQGKDGPVITETGFLIMDAFFADIPDGLHADLKSMPGVLETGIFQGFNVELLHEG
jgi:ribose 5-phosphate isomerase A